MPTHHNVLFAAISLIASVSLVPAARACQPPHPSVYARKSLPADGAVAVPTNARVMVVYSVSYLSAGRVQLPVSEFEQVAVRPLGGEAIAAGVAIQDSLATVALIITPSVPLAPDTTYEVLDRVRVGQSDQLIGDTLEVVATFTTGHASDAIAPAAPPPIEVTTGCPTCESDACCGPYSARAFSLTWGETPADTLVEVTNVGGAVAWPDGDVASGWLDSAYYNQPDFRTEGTFQVRFVDVAGNRSPATTVVVDVVCTPVADDPGDADVGPSDTAEMGAEPADSATAEGGDAAVPRREDDSGCAGAPRDVSVALALLALIGFCAPGGVRRIRVR